MEGLVSVNPETTAVLGSPGIVAVPPGLRVAFAQKEDPGCEADGQ
jgi:hypothetical protein